MYVERIQTLDELTPLLAAWNARTDQIPFRGSEWITAWASAYQPEQQLYLIGVFDKPPADPDRQLVGLAPLYREQSTSKGNVLKLLGSGEVCSDYMSLVCHPEGIEAVSSAVADFLIDHASDQDHQWDLLELENVESSDLAINRLVEKLWEQDSGVNRTPGVNCWRLQLPKTWEEFEATQSKSHRKQIRRFVRRVLDTERAELQICDSSDKLDAAFEVLIDLHMRRRNSLDQPGCFASSQFETFLRDAASRMVDQGQCEILQLNLDERPVAAEIHFIDGNIAYAYQAGVDPDRLDEQPGSLMQAAVIRHAIERGFIAMDFLRGDEPYKAHWRAEPRECTNLRIVPNRTSSQLRNGIWMAGSQMKNLIKTGMNLTGM
ncbi:MAG: hypothetical protein COA78_22645 [Blastopirellula sp.]|nr:MAG: hypothetical protein COA78_22645 [Blastopirellula sp.]